MNIHLLTWKDKNVPEIRDSLMSLKLKLKKLGITNKKFFYTLYNLIIKILIFFH